MKSKYIFKFCNSLQDAETEKELVYEIEDTSIVFTYNRALEFLTESESVAEVHHVIFLSTNREDDEKLNDLYDFVGKHVNLAGFYVSFEQLDMENGNLCYNMPIHRMVAMHLSMNNREPSGENISFTRTTNLVFDLSTEV